MCGHVDVCVDVLPVCGSVCGMCCDQLITPFILFYFISRTASAQYPHCPDLLGSRYVGPYLHLPGTLAFALVVSTQTQLYQ